MTPESAAVATKPQMRMVTISLAVAFTRSSGGLSLIERHGGGDEAHVRERLREVSHRRAGSRLELLAEESHVVGISREPLESALRPRFVARVGEVFHGPEAARSEGVLGAMDAVLEGLRPIALHEAVAHERAPDELERALHARILGMRVAVAREEQQARVG